MSTTLSGNPSTVYGKSEGQKFKADTTLTVVSCATCGVTYAIPESFYRSALAYRGDTSNGWKICCPFGHTWWYVGMTDEDKLRERLQDARDRAGRLVAERDQLATSLRGTKANAARTRKDLKSLKTRAKHGVCPCCNRTFKQLAAHMKNKHPEYVEGNPA